MSGNLFNLADLLRIIFRWRKLVLLFTLAAVVASIVVAYLLPVYYRSTAIFYGYNMRGFDPRNMMGEEPLEIFGNEEDTDRLISVGSSSAIEDSVIRKFDLYKRYDISPSEQYHVTKVKEKFRKMYSIQRNSKGAIEVSILDKDPQAAADMCNEIVRLIDILNKRPVLDNSRKLYKVFKGQLDKKQRALDSLLTSVRAAGKSATESFKEVDLRLSEDLAETIELRENYERIEGLLFSDLPSINIVEQGAVAEKKASPVRWIIVAASTIGAFLFIILFILAYELYRNEFGNGQRSL